MTWYAYQPPTHHINYDVKLSVFDLSIRHNLLILSYNLYLLYRKIMFIAVYEGNQLLCNSQKNDATVK